MGSRQDEKNTNRLIHEKSPYLLQHAHNPVDWFPWSEEAFAKAKAENKPIFLSIGYSTCHWCHVMEKECFEDEEVARLMNETFVCIKVDREERPDLDAIYMTVCQLMGRNCGWPLNILMSPDKNPFFAASYIPKFGRFGLSGMLELVPQVIRIWKTRRTELEEVGKDLTNKIALLEKRSPANELEMSDLKNAYEMLAQRFDMENGGFGSAPKFPTPHNLLFLLRYWKRSGNENALKMVEKTLDAMRSGGIFDQVGFGFHRYSTDRQWLVPHFEKMLYDQAMLALVYIEMYQVTRSERFSVTAKEILDYVMRDMTSPEGGFYSAEDADSEGEEGKFYVWKEEEIREALSKEEADFAKEIFGTTARGNFHEPNKGFSGRNILYLPKPMKEVATQLGTTVDSLISKFSRIQKTLFSVREKRVHPSKDYKILTDWNGLMIAALARASFVLDEEKYLQAAIRTADFIQERLKGRNGRLFHRYAKYERAIEGFLDDYAFFAFGLLEIYQTNFESRFFDAASEVINGMIELFWDDKEGGFYFAAETARDDLPKQKQIYDGALPSGNSVALLDLLYATSISGNVEFEVKASRMNSTFAGEVRESPAAYTFFLAGVDFALSPTYNVVFVGDPDDEDMKAMIKALKGNYLPHAVFSLKRSGNRGLGYKQIDGKATAYVCRDKTCFPPTNDKQKAMKILDLESSAKQ